MKKFSKLALAVLLVLSMVLTFGCGGDKPADQNAQQPAAGQQQSGGDEQPVEKTTYIVGTEPTFPPFEYVDEDDQLVGFDIDLMKAIAADQGFEVEFKSLGFDALTIEVDNGGIDMIAAGLSFTPERLEQIDMSDPYFNAGLSIMVPADSEIASSADLTGKIIGSQIGTTGAETCYGMQDEGTVKDVKILDTYDLCALELNQGSTDAIIIDTPVGERFVASSEGKLKLLDEQLLADDYGIGVKKGNAELLTLLNTGLANIQANGVYDQLIDKYFTNAAAETETETVSGE